MTPPAIEQISVSLDRQAIRSNVRAMNRSDINAPTALPTVNWIGFGTLFSMEFRRYLKAWPYSIGAPVLTTLLFFAVFDLALGDLRADVAGVPFLTFLAPGLITMTVMMTAFEITAWSTIDAKIRGAMDVLVAAPLRPIEFVGAHVLAGAASGLVNGLLVVIAIQPFEPMAPQAPLALVLFASASAILMACAGTAAGIHAEKYDHVATVVNFLVMPSIFLSGVFFPISAYASPFADIALASPFFWAIDGLRQALIGAGEMPVAGSAVMLWLLTGFAFLGLTVLVARGYKLKR